MDNITPVIKESTDKELIDRYKTNDDQLAFTEILNRYYHLIYGACFKILGTEDDAKDVCLDVCESLCTKLKEGEIEFFSSWLFRVCQNRAVSFIRNRETRRRHEGMKLSSEKSGENSVENRMLQRLSPQTDENNQFDRAKDQLGELMSQLPKAQRFCLQLFYFKKMSYAQIAAATNSEIKQVKSHLQSGKRKLKLLFEAQNQPSKDH